MRLRSIRLSLAGSFLGVALLMGATDHALSQGWPKADCPALLQAGLPRPVWGSNEKPEPTALLTLINYQLAISLCQQEEANKALREQRASASKDVAKDPQKDSPKPTVRLSPSPSPKDQESLREALRESHHSAPSTENAGAAGSQERKSVVGTVTAVSREPQQPASALSKP